MRVQSEQVQQLPAQLSCKQKIFTSQKFNQILSYFVAALLFDDCRIQFSLLAKIKFSNLGTKFLQALPIHFCHSSDKTETCLTNFNACFVLHTYFHYILSQNDKLIDELCQINR